MIHSNQNNTMNLFSNDGQFTIAGVDVLKDSNFSSVLYLLLWE